MVYVSAKIVLFASLRKKYKTKELAVKCDGTLQDLIENASKILGDRFFDDVYDRKQGKVREDIILMINGRNFKDLKGKVEINDGAVIAVFPPLGGG